MNISSVEITNLKEYLWYLAEKIEYYTIINKDYGNALELYKDTYQELANAGEDDYLIKISSKYKINF